MNNTCSSLCCVSDEASRLRGNGIKGRIEEMNNMCPSRSPKEMLLRICLSSVASISANLSSIPVLDGTNFKEWKENILIVLGCMDLDLALRIDRPSTPKDSSSSEEKLEYEKWDRSNRISLMIIKRGIPEVFRGAVPDEIDTAKNFLAEMEKRFVKSDKAETSSLLQNLISMKYQGKGNIREHIMMMSNIASKLKGLKLELSDDLLIHLVLLSLPSQFSQFKPPKRFPSKKKSMMATWDDYEESDTEEGEEANICLMENIEEDEISKCQVKALVLGSWLFKTHDMR
ncbi:uncharacterized protein [Cicer arietinum]|uniref:uncharacterized protein n=1 Tax=Cicer arietinum TaxID=3827 RepID=UPI003CC56EBF